MGVGLSRGLPCWEILEPRSETIRSDPAGTLRLWLARDRASEKLKTLLISIRLELWRHLAPAVARKFGCSPEPCAGRRKGAMQPVPKFLWRAECANPRRGAS